ncbi:MAG: type II toxin-antitoxin system VapC family toxin [Candidatus Methylomirabilota bacterium]
MFWDSSAVVPLLLPDARSAGCATLLRSDTEPALWWASPVECQSALYRRRREGALPPAALAQALERLKALVADVDIVAPTTPLRERAGRLLAGHALRSADALQLAAALVWCDESPQGDAFVCLDDRLAEAARREGFTVLPG